MPAYVELDEYSPTAVVHCLKGPPAAKIVLGVRVTVALCVQSPTQHRRRHTSNIRPPHAGNDTKLWPTQRP